MSAVMDIIEAKKRLHETVEQMQERLGVLAGYIDAENAGMISETWSAIKADATTLLAEKERLNRGKQALALIDEDMRSSKLAAVVHDDDQATECNVAKPISAEGGDHV